ncbi:IclR family transcriptional regulator [Advenella kashmirensis W13003]|uniref:IclR family transcriptional regulator n=1 Tax=Advenella kashmirensis W13003 TaxID=1424334 RepID=V8QQJ1_9BURK|nr:IclR family transcriptional regulator [Advenella kashmirensis]ETF01603.1 IclR family transcriptional regulator [Advenella kashmirensis W13003]
MEKGDEQRVLRSLRIMEAIVGTSMPMSLAQLAAKTNIPKASVARNVEALINSGYVALIPDRRELIPGPRAVSMSIGVLGNGHFRRECRAILRKLVQMTGETCNFTVLDGDQVKYIERVQTKMPLQVHLEAGTRAPLYCTAGGKLFLSNMTQPVRESILMTLQLDALTERTITDPIALNRELDRVQKLGYGVDNQEFIFGMIGMAVPVKTSKAGVTVAALVCHATVARTSIVQLEKHLPAFRSAALELSALILQ